ncbi:outer membrane beta-barrel protein [Psychrilyobacter sp.]|uniref:outer membrane beta-barrel protein n=1 Tax=Psychrilyobacter sp. TaxID=2586924 RepID=UPI00301A03DF
MKILFILIILSTASFAESNFYINSKVGIDIISGYDRISDDSGKTLLNGKTKKIGGEVAIEGYKILNENIDLGLGVAYQVHAGRKTFAYTSNVDTSGVQYTSIPVYLTSRYNFLLDSEARPYLKANLGYPFNFNSSDLETKNPIDDRTKKSNKGKRWFILGDRCWDGIQKLHYRVNLCNQ